MKKSSSLNVSIVLYLTPPHQLKKAIESVLSCRETVKALYIIDNSPDDSLKKFCTHKKIDYIFTGANLGYGAGHNIALTHSIEDKIDYHLVMNPDIYFDEDVLKKLFYFMNLNSDIGQVMPTVYYPDGSIQYLCKLLPTPSDLIIRRFSPFKKCQDRRNFFYELRFSGYKEEMDIPSLSGCFMFLRVETLKKAGLFDHRFFMYLEDLDLTRRIAKFGRTVYWPGVHVYHEYGKGSYKSPRMLFYHIKSAVAYFNKWGWFIDKERSIINKKIIEKYYALTD